MHDGKERGGDPEVRGCERGQDGGAPIHRDSTGLDSRSKKPQEARHLKAPSVGDRPALRVVEDQSIAFSCCVEQARLASAKAEALVALARTRKHDKPQGHWLSKSHDWPWTRKALVHDFLDGRDRAKQVPQQLELADAIEVNDY